MTDEKDQPGASPPTASPTTASPTTALDEARSTSSQALVRIMLGAGGLVLAIGATVFLSNAVFTTQPPPEPAEIEIDACSPAALAADTTGCLPREAYLNASRILHTTLKPQISDLALAFWSAAGAEEIQALEDSANEAFDKAEYITAEETMSQAVNRAQEELARAPQVLRAALESMTTAFDAGDTELASTSLARAKWIDANHPAVLDYEPRVRNLSQALILLNTAKIARVENRPTVELAALEELVKLDPARREHLARIASIKDTKRENAYSTAVSRAEQALERAEYPKARRHVSTARQLAPQQDFGFLVSRIEAGERAQRLQRALAAGDAAAAGDDWASAHTEFERALAIDSGDKHALTGRDEAATVVAALASLTTYVAQPLRLASPRVAEFAKRDLANFQPLLTRSNQLQNLEQRVQGYLQQAVVPVTVSVLSDGATDISVRRVGVVGRHKTKRIQLTPGYYEFEGSRRGYKSALVKLEIPYGAVEVEVRVVANERI